MNNINQIVFSKDKYGNNREKMFEAIAKQLALLMENDYVCKVYDDDVDVIVIEFEHDEKRDAWGCDELCWLSPEEAEFIVDRRTTEEYDNEEM